MTDTRQRPSGFARGTCQHWWRLWGCNPRPGTCPECGAEAYAWSADRVPTPEVWCDSPDHDPDDPHPDDACPDCGGLGYVCRPSGCRGEAVAVEE